MISLTTIYLENYCLILCISIFLAFSSRAETIEEECEGEWFDYDIECENIKIEDVNNVDLAVVYISLQLPCNTNEEKEKAFKRLNASITTENFDPILASLYIDSAIGYKYIQKNKLNQDIFPIVKMFYMNEPNNSLASYFMSYYYFFEGNERLAAKYFREGNKRNNLNRYYGQQKDILFDYARQRNKSEMESYSFAASVYRTNAHDIIVPKLMLDKDLINAQDLYNYAQVYLNSSESIIELIIGTAANNSAVYNEKNEDIKSEMSVKPERYKNLLNTYECQKGEDARLKYLKDLYENGEVEAMKNLPWNYKSPPPSSSPVKGEETGRTSP